MMPEVPFDVYPDDRHLEKELWHQLVKQVMNRSNIQVFLKSQYHRVHSALLNMMKS
jgi:hypothetical protein